MTVTINKVSADRGCERLDALIAQLTVAGGHTRLTTEKDFQFAARHVDLRVWAVC